MTNLENIRRKTDKEISDFIYEIGVLRKHPWCSKACEECGEKNCEKCRIDWLHEERTTFREIREELEFAIENGCDHEFLEEALHALEEMRGTICSMCKGQFELRSNGACEGCRWKR